MARTQVPATFTSQFFINTKDNDFLNRSSRSAVTPCSDESSKVLVSSMPFQKEDNEPGKRRCTRHADAGRSIEPITIKSAKYYSEHMVTSRQAATYLGTRPIDGLAVRIQRVHLREKCSPGSVDMGGVSLEIFLGKIPTNETSSDTGS